mgnify:CR=1 FL=1|tara:strand:+ start:3571 stop:3795 length:225 start_codon:yes stop_codon:yes gene_type:complete
MIKLHEKRKILKELDSIDENSFYILFNKKDIKEIKKYAAVLKTPMHEVFFKDQNNKEFLKKEIIEDIKLVIFGE